MIVIKYYLHLSIFSTTFKESILKLVSNSFAIKIYYSDISTF